MDFAEELVMKINERAKQNATDNEYLAEDGLLHCKTCKQKVETIIPVGNKQMKVRCICQCKKNEMDAVKEREKQEELDRMRKICFPETNMASWTFKNDDRQNPKISDAMMKYSIGFKEFKAESKGLLLYGTVGTGKTYYAACIANDLICQGYKVLMTNFARLTNILQGKQFEDKQQYIDSLNHYSLLIIDDLGAERKSEYMQEMVFNIIDSRYRSGLPFIITTNLTAEEIKKPQEIGYSRIYDRILERCFPIAVEGQSRRRKELKETFTDVKERLGL